jgi:hypothetical protein
MKLLVRISLLVIQLWLIYLFEQVPSDILSVGLVYGGF